MQSPLKRKVRPYIPLLTRVIVGFVLFLLLILVIGGCQWAQKQGLSLSQIWYILRATGDGLKQDAQGRTNIVLLGMRGDGYEGGDLTDTLIVVSLGINKSDTVLVSLPRDIWISSLKDKINSAYHTGEVKKKGGGLILAKATVEEIVGMPIHYGLLIDFSGFKTLIDTVGGIEVRIADAFTDTRYPIAGKENEACQGDPEFNCRYETVTFTEGIEHMDGARSLVYVRSRHAQGEAGSDFSRNRRQQAVLLALKQKVVTPQVLLDPFRFKEILGAVDGATTTDLNLGESLLLGRIFIRSKTQVRSISLTQDEPQKGKPGLLLNPPLRQYGGVWVLVPKHEGYGEIHRYISCVIEAASGCDELLNLES